MTSQRGIPLDWMSYFVCGNVKCALVGYMSAIRRVLSSCLLQKQVRCLVRLILNAKPAFVNILASSGEITFFHG